MNLKLAFLVFFLHQQFHLNSFQTNYFSENHVQKTQNLGISACIEKPENFCSEQVENSVCNRLKNECFCKKGFVAIREEDRVTCKTLLTNLKCRIDSDCIHVSRSTCHPGAGQCACPGDTIYSKELHACRSRYYGEQNSFCLTCQQMAGVCFKYESTDNTSVAHRTKDGYVGCSCPSDKGTNKANFRNISDLCQTTLSDIGEYCDEKKYICQARDAVCRGINENNENRLCFCPKGKVAVYQSHLHFYECFRKLSKSNPHCMNCHNAGGQCYDMNNDEVGDGCLCPSRLSSESSNIEFQLNKQLCKIDRVHESCSNGYFSICYQPHTEAPYEYLPHNLESNISLAVLSSNNEEDCQLKSIYGHNKYCTRIDVFSHKKNCDVRFYKIKHNKYFYEANLLIKLDRRFRQPFKDISIPISCVSSNIQRTIENVSTKGFISKTKPASPMLNLGLQVLDKFNKEIFTVMEGSEIKLDVSLVDSEGKFRSMRVEECYSSNHSSLINDQKLNIGEKIISKGCPMYRNGFYAAFNTQVTPGIHLQSDIFALHRYGSLHSIFFKCFIKICSFARDCEKVHCNTYEVKPDTEETEQRPDSNSLIYERWAHVEVQKFQSIKNTQLGTDKAICHHVVCLTASQTILIALLLLFLLLMVTVLLIFYSRSKSGPQNHTHKFSPNEIFSSNIWSNSDAKRTQCSSEISNALIPDAYPSTLTRSNRSPAAMENYITLTPQINTARFSSKLTDQKHIYTNIFYDLQGNPYAQQQSPKCQVSKSERSQIPFQTFSSDGSSTNNNNNIINSNNNTNESCYISIRRPDIFISTSSSYKPDQTITQCSCGSKECEYQPFIVSSSVA